MPALIYFRLFKQVVRLAVPLARPNTRNNKAAKIPMMAMTTNSSIKVKDDRLWGIEGVNVVSSEWESS